MSKIRLLNRWFIGVVLLLGLGGTGWARPASFIDGDRLRCESNGVSFGLPRGWELGSASDGTPLFARLTRLHGRAQLLAFVVASGHADGFPPSSEIEHELNRVIRGFLVRQVAPISLGGIPFQEYRAVGSAGARQYSLFYGVANERAFMFLLLADQADSTAAREEVLNSLKGVQFFEARQKPPVTPTDSLEPA